MLNSYTCCRHILQSVGNIIIMWTCAPSWQKVYHINITQKYNKLPFYTVGNTFSTMYRKHVFKSDDLKVHL